MPLLLALLGLVTTPHAARERVMAIDTDSGMAVEFPQEPRHSFKQLGDLTQSVYLSRDQHFGYLFMVTSPPRDDERFLDSNSLDTLDKKIGALIPGVIDERSPANFGPCRGYVYAGHDNIGGGVVKYDARFVLVGTCWVLMEVFGETDPAKSPDTQAYFDSLVLCIDGRLPVGHARQDDVSAKVHASIDADMGVDPAIDADQLGGNAAGFIKTDGESQVLLRSIEFDDSQRSEFLSQEALTKAQVRIEDFVGMKETSDRSFFIGPYSGKEFDMENSEFHARARLFGFGNRRYTIIYESRGPVDDNVANQYLNSFRIDFSQIQN
jgi:hypothetical protein